MSHKVIGDRLFFDPNVINKGDLVEALMLLAQVIKLQAFAYDNMSRKKPMSAQRVLEIAVSTILKEGPGHPGEFTAHLLKFVREPMPTGPRRKRLADLRVVSDTDPNDS